MPVDPNIAERTEAKLRYARLHVDELTGYVNLGSLDDWERAHAESVLFHLVGAKDSFLQEVNSAFALGLSLNSVNERALTDKIHERDVQPEALNRINELRENKDSWYSLMIELRNHVTHRNNISRLGKIGVGSAKDTPRTSHFKHPQTNEMIEDDVVVLLQRFCDCLGGLISDLRQSLP